EDIHRQGHAMLAAVDHVHLAVERGLVVTVTETRNRNGRDQEKQQLTHRGINSVRKKGRRRPQARSPARWVRACGCRSRKKRGPASARSRLRAPRFGASARALAGRVPERALPTEESSRPWSTSARRRDKPPAKARRSRNVRPGPAW